MIRKQFAQQAAARALAAAIDEHQADTHFSCLRTAALLLIISSSTDGRVEHRGRVVSCACTDQDWRFKRVPLVSAPIHHEANKGVDGLLFSWVATTP